MKKLLLTFSAVLFTASVFAGNLLVKEYGVNGTYSTIQDAIDAAQDGDTIIVFNKPSGQYWLEDLVISKEVFLENSDANQRFDQLDGDIRIDPQDGKKMFFLGVDLMSGHKIYSNGGASDPANRCEINIMDCSMGEAEFEDNNLHMRILDSDITTVSFKYGIMAGCTGDNLTVSKGVTASATDSLVIVGNKNYRLEACQNNKIVKHNYTCNTHPHQIYFEFLAEHGLVGTMILLFILFNLVFSKLTIILKSKNYIQIGCFIYLFISFIPFLPSGAFFGDYHLTIFWLNLSLMYSVNKRTNIFLKN